MNFIKEKRNKQINKMENKDVIFERKSRKKKRGIRKTD